MTLRTKESLELAMKFFLAYANERMDFPVIVDKNRMNITKYAEFTSRMKTPGLIRCAQ